MHRIPASSSSEYQPPSRSPFSKEESGSGGFPDLDMYPALCQMGSTAASAQGSITPLGYSLMISHLAFE